MPKTACVTCRVVAAAVLLLCAIDTLEAQERAITHAPIGVMGDHYHGKGEWMVSVRQMGMWMAGNRNETTDLEDNEIIALANPY